MPGRWCRAKRARPEPIGPVVRHLNDGREGPSDAVDLALQGGEGPDQAQGPLWACIQPETGTQGSPAPKADGRAPATASDTTGDGLHLEAPGREEVEVRRLQGRGETEATEGLKSVRLGRQTAAGPADAVIVRFIPSRPRILVVRRSPVCRSSVSRPTSSRSRSADAPERSCCPHQHPPVPLAHRVRVGLQRGQHPVPRAVLRPLLVPASATATPSTSRPPST